MHLKVTGLQVCVRTQPCCLLRSGEKCLSDGRRPVGIWHRHTFQRGKAMFVICYK